MKKCRKFWQGAKFSQGANLPFHAHYSSFQPLFMFPAFDFLTSFGHFLVFFPFCPPVIAFTFGFFGILYYGLAIKALDMHYNRISFINKVSFWREAFNSPASFPFLLFSLTFWVAKHPPRMITWRMSG